MKHSPLSLLVSILFLSVVLVVEKVAGLPVLALLLFHHLVLSRNVVFQMSAIIVFTIFISSLYMVSPIAVTLVLSAGVTVLSLRQNRSLQARSWEYVYVSVIQAAAISTLANVVIQLELLVSFSIQMALIIIWVRRVVFRGMTQSYHWGQQVATDHLHEKRI